MLLFGEYLLVGVVAGFLAGLFGVGGGTIIVPMLLILLPQSGIPAEQVMTVALGTSFATIVCSSISSAWHHRKLNNVEFSVFRYLVPSIMLSVFVFGYGVSFLPKAVLIKMFAVMMLFLSLKMFWSNRQAQVEVKPLTPKTQITAGVIIGALSSFAGIGGGSFIVPFLYGRGFEMKRAIGTSSACGVLLAFGATMSFMLSGQNVANMPEYSIGFVYLPAFLGIVCSSVFTSRLGAICAHKLPVAVLKRAFAGFLCLVAISMFLK